MDTACTTRPAKRVKRADEDGSLKYNPGFGNLACSEALPGALPAGQNNPQRCPYGLYAEQLSGTAFTKPRKENARVWLYRIRPSVQHAPMEALPQSDTFGGVHSLDMNPDPNQMRWMPVDIESSARVTFVQGLKTYGAAGDPTLKHGLAVHYFTANAPMGDSCMVNCDGDFLIVPQKGVMRVRTEFGIMRVEPNEICVVQRGMRFSVDPSDDNESGELRGYILEIYAKHFDLPDLGPIGSNGLANPQDFLSPVAWYEDRDCDFVCITKYGGRLFQSTMAFSPYNVVAFRGNYLPYKYDLRKFNCMNSVTYDHPDPSIYTVLTCQTDEAGVAVADFVIFPPRWMAMENTFRPPWYHRNTMSEFMGMIWGEYDAKGGSKGSDGKPKGFVPGGASLHSCMVPHGPDAGTFSKASKINGLQQPVFFDKGLAFMFETTYMLKLSKWALEGDHRDKEYYKCWASLPHQFDPNEKPPTGASDILAWRAERSNGSA